LKCRPPSFPNGRLPFRNRVRCDRLCEGYCLTAQSVENPGINKVQAELLSQRKMGCASGMMSGVPLFGFLYSLTPDFQRWDLELPLGYSCVTAFPTVFRQPLVSPQNRHHDIKPIYANSGTYLQRYPASGLCTTTRYLMTLMEGMMSTRIGLLQVGIGTVF
jgi:hypothetical protein